MEQKHKPRRNASPALTNLGDLVIIKRTPAAGSDLTDAEREFLDDPDWITEDEADALMAERIFRAEAAGASLFGST